MKIKNIYIVPLLISILALTACEGFLNRVPKHEYTSETAVVDYNSSLNVVNGVYSKLSPKGFGGHTFLQLSSQAGVYNYNEDYYNMSYIEGTNDNKDTWLAMYTCINAANAAIVGIEALDVSEFPSEQEKLRLIAEVRCLRGFVNAHIFWLWGHFWAEPSSEYGLLYRDQMADLSNLLVPRLSVGESYTKIIEDLEYAELNLGSFKSSRYASKELAQAMLAKLYLNRGADGDYAKSLALVQKVKASAPATFKQEPDLKKLYDDAWDSQEVLFTRYLDEKGGYSSRTYLEFAYSYRCVYTAELRGVTQDWLENDPRMDVIMGTVRAPETWDTRTFWAFEKLCHRGRFDGPNDKYATYYFRYSELYLMEAELLARLNPGDIVGALVPLNKMRTTLTNPLLPALTASTHEDLMDMIFQEIVMTLFLENGSEWFASLRFQKDGKSWMEYLKTDVNAAADVNKRCWPIPSLEMNTNTEMIQNPGLN